MKKKLPKFRFMAMSKLLGILAISLVFIVVIYTMQEMHNSGNYDALPQLILSVFGLASVYVGFYLTMAKMEHVEEEKTKREKELALLQKKEAPQEDIADKRQEIENLRQKMNDLISESTQSLL